MDQKKPRHQGGAFVVNRNGCLIVFGRSAGSPVVWAGCLSVLSAADGGMGARGGVAITTAHVGNGSRGGATNSSADVGMGPRGTAVLSTGDGGRRVVHKAQ